MFRTSSPEFYRGCVEIKTGWVGNINTVNPDKLVLGGDKVNRPFDMNEYMVKVRWNMDVYVDWRYGQALFNTLYDMWPHIADKVRATENDPFYDNEKVKNFWNWLQDWEQENTND